MPRYEPVQTSAGHGVIDHQDLGQPVVRSGLSRCTAELVASALNDLHEDNVFLRAMLCGHGIEIRPERRAG